MSLVKSTVSIAAVAAAIALTTAAPSYAAAGDEQVPCKGQNGCKGQGFKDLTKEQCAAAGGSLKAPK